MLKESPKCRIDPQMTQMDADVKTGYVMLKESPKSPNGYTEGSENTAERQIQSHHEGHEGNEGNTDSQRITAGTPAIIH